MRRTDRCQRFNKVVALKEWDHGSSINSCKAMCHKVNFFAIFRHWVDKFQHASRSLLYCHWRRDLMRNSINSSFLSLHLICQVPGRLISKSSKVVEWHVISEQNRMLEHSIPDWKNFTEIVHFAKNIIIIIIIK